MPGNCSSKVPYSYIDEILGGQTFNHLTWQILPNKMQTK